MTIITAKQNALEKHPSVTDWMASFLDFQISKLEERRQDLRPTVETKLPKTRKGPIWNESYPA